MNKSKLILPAIFLLLAISVSTGVAEEEESAPVINGPTEQEVQAENDLQRATDPRPSINADSAEILANSGVEGLTLEIAQKIVDYRARNGGYRYVQQLLDAGIGNEAYRKIKDNVSLRAEIVARSPGEGD